MTTNSMHKDFPATHEFRALVITSDANLVNQLELLCQPKVSAKPPLTTFVFEMVRTGPEAIETLGQNPNQPHQLILIGDPDPPWKQFQTLAEVRKINTRINVVLIHEDPEDVLKNPPLGFKQDHRIHFLSSNPMTYQVQSLFNSLADSSLLRARADHLTVELREAREEINTIDQDLLWCREQILKLEKARDQAKLDALGKTQYLVFMSHEIRTPLNGIMGVIELLKETRIDQKQLELLEIIQESSESLLYVINDILDLGKIEAGKMKMAEKPFLLEDCLNGSVNLLRARANQKGNRIKVTSEDGIPEVLLGDFFRLRQVLNNLISNAIQFTENGTIWIDVSIKEQSKDFLELQFMVKDSGIGFSKESAQILFQAFEQITSEDSELHTGTGMGLTICRHIVEMMQGKIWFESKPGKGATFYFTAHFQPSTRSELRAPETAINVERPQRPKQRAKTILLVEDNPTNRQVISLYLKNSGYKFDCAINGKKALELLRENEYGLILMDIQMPILDGFKTTAIIRKELKLETPIVAITANAFQRHRDHCFEIGMNGFIPKPISREVLMSVVQQWAGKSRKAGISSATPKAASTSLAEDENTPINLPKVNSEFGKDTDLLKNVIKQFLKNADKQLELMLLAGLDGNFELISKEAHAIKGGSANLCATPMAEIAEKIEELSDQGNPPQIFLHLLMLAKALGALDDYTRIKLYGCLGQDGVAL